MVSPRRARLKALIERYFVVIVVVLSVVAAGGAWATYTTAVDPGMRTDQQVVASWEANGNFNYSATVVNATPLAPRGAVRADRKFYFTNAMPVLDGRFGFGFDGASGAATVTTRTKLVNYAVQTQPGIAGGSGVPVASGFGNRTRTTSGSRTRLWQFVTPLGTERRRLRSGETANTTFAVDVSDIRERVRRIDAALGPISEVTDDRTSVVVSVAVDGTIGGERVERTFEYALPINSSTGYYAVYPARGPDTQQFDVMRPVTVPNRYGPFVVFGSVVGFALPMVALAGLFYGRENDRFAVSAAERAAAERTRVRSEFAEWITKGIVPTDNRTAVRVDSLDGLVDVAIDSDRRVIENTETDSYVVIDDDVRYVFTPERPADTGTAAEAESEPKPEPDSRDGPTATAGASGRVEPAENRNGSDDGTGDAYERPTTVVELPGPTSDDRGDGTGPDAESETETDGSESGVFDRLRTVAESMLGGSNETRGDAEANQKSDGIESVPENDPSSGSDPETDER